MARKVLFVREDLMPPFDEGMKIFSLRTLNALRKIAEVRVAHDALGVPRGLNRLLLAPRAAAAALRYRAHRVIYIPEASITINSFVRARMMEMLLPCPVVLVGLQARRYSERQARIIRRIAPRRLFVLSQAMADGLESMGVQARVLPFGIDRDAFSPAPEKKEMLRARYGVRAGSRVVLHVGHIRRERNLGWLLELQRAISGTQVLIVGSTTTEADEGLRRELEDGGVLVIRDYLPHIEEAYQLADCYVFPVQREDAAMELPLSVLEAMSANLPVASTRFGRLLEIFREDKDLRYAESAGQMIDAVRGLLKHGAECRNRDKTAGLEWGETAQALLEDPPCS